MKSIPEETFKEKVHRSLKALHEHHDASLYGLDLGEAAPNGDVSDFGFWYDERQYPCVGIVSETGLTKAVAERVAALSESFDTLPQYKQYEVVTIPIVIIEGLRDENPAVDGFEIEDLFGIEGTYEWMAYVVTQTPPTPTA